MKSCYTLLAVLFKRGKDEPVLHIAHYQYYPLGD